MSETNDPISVIAVKYMNGNATPAEITRLQEWAAQSEENKNWLDRFTDHKWITSSAKKLNAIDLDACAADFYQRLHTYRQVKIARKWKRKVMVSAAVILLVSCVPWLFIQPSGSTPVTHTTQPTTPPDKDPEPAASPSTDNTIYNSNDGEQPSIDNNTTGDPTTPSQQAQRFPDANHQQPGPQVVSWRGAFVSTREKRAAKDHAIINKERTILPAWLPDTSSTYILNSESAIIYPDVFEDTARKISLNGEAYVTVVKKDSIPLYLKTKEAQVKTYGGAFNIRAYDNEKLTVVTAVTGELTVATDAYDTIIKPGETAIVQKGSPIEVYKKNNKDRVIAYTNRLFHYHNDDLYSALVEIARWYGLTLVGTAQPGTKLSCHASRIMKIEDLIKKLVITGKNTRVKLSGNQLIIEASCQTTTSKIKTALH